MFIVAFIKICVLREKNRGYKIVLLRYDTIGERDNQNNKYELLKKGRRKIIYEWHVKTEANYGKKMD